MDNFPFGTEHQPGTVIDWYLQRMSASGITEEVARRCGLTLELGDDTPYINIPYFTIDGIQTTHSRQRNREPRTVYEEGQSSGNFKGKYTQKKGSKNHVYWPPILSQRVPFNDPSCPLLVCEGEFKSIAGFRAAIANGAPMLVCGVPGTSICPSVIEDLRSINCLGSNGGRRTVYISVDWNGRGKSREHSAKLEFELKKLFQELGAKTIILRWPIEEGCKEEQKLDDWLVAGGDLSKAIRLSHDKQDHIDTELSALWDYFNGNYAICHGFYIPLRDHRQKYTITQFHIMEPGKCLQISPRKTLKPCEVWGLQPQEDRNVVDGYTFLPAPLGIAPEQYVWEDGKRLLNTAPPVVPINASPFDPLPDVSPFLNLLERLAQEGAPWLLQYLAHGAQFPTERGQHIVIFRDEGGTGKSALFDTMDQVFGPYSGPVGTGMSSSFNAGLEHLLLAHWSDPVIHGGFDRDLESALKNYSGDVKIEINHKGGAKYHVRNYGRLFIATNKDWIVPLDSKERRYTVFGGLSTWPYEEWEAYAKWLKSGGVDAIRAYLTSLDLSEFSISAPGPRTAQRLLMEKASSLPLIRMLDVEPFDQKDIWTCDEIRAQYKEQTGKSLSNESIGVVLAKIGAVKRIVKDSGKTVRLAAIRNFEKWNGAPNEEWREEARGAKF